MLLEDKEDIKKKISGRLPDFIPKVLKTVVMHIIMAIYHISIPPWVRVMKVKKGMKSYKNTTEEYTEKERERSEKTGRRRQRRRRRY